MHELSGQAVVHDLCDLVQHTRFLCYCHIPAYTSPAGKSGAASSQTHTLKHVRSSSPSYDISYSDFLLITHAEVRSDLLGLHQQLCSKCAHQTKRHRDRNVESCAVLLSCVLTCRPETAVALPAAVPAAAAVAAAPPVNEVFEYLKLWTGLGELQRQAFGHGIKQTQHKKVNPCPCSAWMI